jgi:hypothetical protein
MLEIFLPQGLEFYLDMSSAALLSVLNIAKVTVIFTHEATSLSTFIISHNTGALVTFAGADP